VRTGFERESLRPLVLRHAYQSETRRYTPRCLERSLLYRIVAENLETLLQTSRTMDSPVWLARTAVERHFSPSPASVEAAAVAVRHVACATPRQSKGGALVFRHRFSGSVASATSGEVQPVDEAMVALASATASCWYVATSAKARGMEIWNWAWSVPARRAFVVVRRDRRTLRLPRRTSQKTAVAWEIPLCNRSRPSCVYQATQPSRLVHRLRLGRAPAIALLVHLTRIKSHPLKLIAVLGIWNPACSVSTVLPVM
jgi:hypothetical protein